MLAGGLVMVALGVIVAFLGFGGGLAGVALALPIGGAIISLGILIAVAGAIVNAIERQGAAALAEIKGAREDFRKGTESTWKQLDRIREGVQSLPTPPSSAPMPVPAEPTAEGSMGHCLGCRKPRHTSVLKCVYCGNMDQVAR